MSPPSDAPGDARSDPGPATGASECGDAGDDDPAAGSGACEWAPPEVQLHPPPLTADDASAVLANHCAAQVGAPRVTEVVDGIWLATGYDLANTIAIETTAGLVIVDVGMTMARAAETRAAIEAVVPGPVAAVIYTHSHVDHVGGALAWVDETTPIWATERFVANFAKQYGAFFGAESARGARQFGTHVDDEHLPCSAIGRRADVAGAVETGAVLPNRVFSGSQSLSIGGIALELVEAPGETDDQLFVWIPGRGTLLAGDNYYAAFPNLYTIRGTSPRPVDEWIRSLDSMRRLGATALIPSHTQPVVGAGAVADALRGYRDGIQWTRDSVVRMANAGLSVDEIASAVSLPDHLSRRGDLSELYGQVDWSARAIYDANLGWFDSRSERLYPPAQAAAREIEMMGGAEVVVSAAVQALEVDARWSAHLVAKLLDAGVELPTELQARVWEGVGLHTANTNGRAWLLEAAAELRGAVPAAVATAGLNDRLLAELPVDVVFSVMPARLRAEATLDVEETLRVDFPTRTFHVTVRRGVAEIVDGEPLPDALAPSATVVTDEGTWKEITIRGASPARYVLSGALQIDDLVAANRILGYFEGAAAAP